MRPLRWSIALALVAVTPLRAQTSDEAPAFAALAEIAAAPAPTGPAGPPAERGAERDSLWRALLRGVEPDTASVFRDTTENLEPRSVPLTVFGYYRGFL